MKDTIYEGRLSMIYVTNLDTGATWGFAAKTAYEAMMKLKYTLDVSFTDPNAVINKTESGRCLYMDHGGNTWAVVNQ